MVKVSKEQCYSQVKLGFDIVTGIQAVSSKSAESAVDLKKDTHQLVGKRRQDLSYETKTTPLLTIRRGFHFLSMVLGYTNPLIYA
jgi:hypothetical protein